MRPRVHGKTDGTGKISVWCDGVAHAGPLAPGYFHPAWSPDSKHFAAVVSHGSESGWAIMVDGKFGPNFEDILVLNDASAAFVTPSAFRYYVFKGSEIYRVTLELGPYVHAQRTLFVRCTALLISSAPAYTKEAFPSSAQSLDRNNQNALSRRLPTAAQSP